jgi:hypothetical protein
MMDRQSAPADDPLFVAPSRQRQDTPLDFLVLETFVVDKTINLLKFRLQEFSQFKVSIP